MSQGKVLNRIFELQNEVQQCLLYLGPCKAELLYNPRWLVFLAYLTVIFEKLNSLNLSLQGPEITPFMINTKISAFKKKLELWRKIIEAGLFEPFPCLAAVLEETE